MAKGRTRKPLGRALREVLTPAGGAARGREEQAPGAGLLAHPARAALFQILLDQPFTNVAQLARSLRTTPPSVRWHLSVLEEAGLVQTRREGRARVAHVPGTTDAHKTRALEALRRPRALLLLRTVSQSPGMTVAEVARAAQTSPQSARRGLQSLAAVGFVESVRDGRNLRSYPGDGLEKLVEVRSDALPAQLRRVQAALEQAGESTVVVRRAHGQVTFAVGRRGARREFSLRSDRPLLALVPP